MFSYDEFTTRNIGFVNAQEQARLRDARVFVCGVGGMGGAAIQSLARAGVEQFAIADIDSFEVSNFNRQVFADLDSAGLDKAEATAQRLRRINPGIRLEVLGAEWQHKLDELLPRYPVVINGMDDIVACIDLYRRAQRHGASVIDAYTSPLPSVTLVGPQALRPEQRLGFASVGRDPADLDATTRAECFLREVEYVLVHSSTVRHIDLAVARDLVAGKRKRMSFAPMVITTGNLMAFEAIKLILGRTPLADARGYFFNPWRMRVERPMPWPLALPRRLLVRAFLRKMLRG